MEEQCMNKLLKRYTLTLGRGTVRVEVCEILPGYVSIKFEYENIPEENQKILEQELKKKIEDNGYPTDFIQ
jgi:hypothetical protein